MAQNAENVYEAAQSPELCGRLLLVRGGSTKSKARPKGGKKMEKIAKKMIESGLEPGSEAYEARLRVEEAREKALALLKSSKVECYDSIDVERIEGGYAFVLHAHEFGTEYPGDELDYDALRKSVKSKLSSMRDIVKSDGFAGFTRKIDVDARTENWTLAF